MEITREQVKQLYGNSQNGSNQLVEADLKNWFPEAFGLEVGKWYKRDGEFLFNFQGKYSVSNDSGSYGFSSNNNNWYENIGVNRMLCYPPATTEEVYMALVAEAKKRGFEGTERIEWKFNDVKYGISRPDLSGFTLRNDVLIFAGGVVFRDGKWAEIITRPLTIEERLTKLESRWTEEH